MENVCRVDTDAATRRERERAVDDGQATAVKQAPQPIDTH
jgi:hypothetical protein